MRLRPNPESVKGDGAAADLQRILLQIRQISKRLAEIEVEVAELTASEIALLMSKVAIAAAKGRNLLAEMKSDVQRRIDLAREECAVQASRMAPR